MKAILMLADAGEAKDRKISALGTGWCVTSSPTPAMALLVYVDCPWDQTNVRHELVIELLDADGRPVQAAIGPHGQVQEVRVEATFQAGRPVEAVPGSPIREALAISLGPGLPLTPGQNYEFRMTIDDEPTDSWLSRFTVLAQ